MKFADLEFATPKDYFEFFAREAARGGSPLYERLGLAFNDELILLSLAALARKGQPPANLVLAAAHYLLLQGANHPLKDYYPSLGGARAVDDETIKTFVAFCAAHRREAEALVAERVTNTNETMRLSTLAPGFAHVAARENAPLALIELGPSAGLNLNFDRYEYAYAAPGAAPANYWGPSPVRIAAEVRGRAPTLPPAPPKIATRIGLELNPVDLAREEDRLWLEALIWPENTVRLARLRAAIAIAQEAPPPIRAGDASLLLPDALAEAPKDAALVVYHSAFLYQLDDAARQRLDTAIAAAAQSRPVWRLSADGIGCEARFPLVAARHFRGAAEETALADTMPHGAWVNWLV